MSAQPDALSSAFAARVEELQQAAALRCSDLTPHAYDLAQLQTSLDSLETGLEDVKSALHEHRDRIARAKALEAALQQQSDHLQFMSSNLPTVLPAAAPGDTGCRPTHATATTQAAQKQPGKENAGPVSAAESAGSQIQEAGSAAAAKSKPAAPRRYITVKDLDSLSSYMRNRLTLDKVNAAVDDVASLAEANAKLISAARQKRSLSAEDRKHVQILIRNISSRVDMKGRYWFLESDLRHGSVLKPDKTSKSILTIMRHLGRLHEVHCLVDEAYANVYVLQ